MYYFEVESSYKCNGVVHVLHSWMCSENEKAMEAQTKAAREGLEEAAREVDIEVVDVRYRMVSEIEYKRHALSKEGKRDTNLKKRKVGN
ncbi:hypothetical protein [Bacillus thuringiensis]|uniref:hypothetical protein n=1 Tax=Bacillus thuringiensis TaxID=1428 RepID=UPI00159C27AC|nr:hypothetical protein [Bacillus thuringiensis]